MQTIKTEFGPEVADFLEEHHALTLSTSSFTGMPHANTAPYVNDGERVYFFAREGSILLDNLTESHRLAFTIDHYTPEWTKVKELHGEGSCDIAGPEDRELALQLAGTKFSGSMPTGVICVLVPASMYFVDYQR